MGIDAGSDSTAPGPAQRDWFETTHWSVVLAAGSGESSAAEHALERLCHSYWYPLYVYVRRQGYSTEDAQDLTQGFFEKLLQKDYLAQTDRNKGRFRAFLLASLKHFIADQRDRERAVKRGGGRPPLSLDAQQAEDRYRLEPVDALTPERLYERRWALTLIAQARATLRQEFVTDGKGELYDLLKGLEIGEPLGLTYASAGQRLGMSESAMKSAALRMRRRYGQLLRHEIAQTVGSEAEVDEEIRYLLKVVGDGA
jgi:DNA-directed RNA polymerase specialized sigma24 family protein